MADITTTTSANRHVALEILSQNAQAANRAEYIRLQTQVHYDTKMDGARSLVRKIHKMADLGVASAGAEATDPSPLPTVELDNGTPVSATISMGVKEVAEISEEDVTTQLGLTTAQVRHMFSGFGAMSVEQWTALMAKYVMQLAPMGYRKREQDIANLQTTLSQSVGDVTKVVSALDLVSAIFKHRKQKPLLGPEFGRFWLNTNMIEQIVKEALFQGFGSNIWNRGDFSLMHIPQGVMAGNGLFGSFLERPVVEVEEDIKVTANSDAEQIASYGNHGIPGVAADARLDGKCGAFELSDKTPLDFRAQADASKCTVEITMVSRYVAYECSDAEAVRIQVKNAS